MADELIDICDEKNNLLGVKKMKSAAHREGLWHRAAHTWIYNSRGEVLLQMRAKNKELYPGVWDCAAAGHVSAGEEPVDSGIREIQEEIGLTVKKEDLEFYKIFEREVLFGQMNNKEFYYVYFLKYDGDIADLKLQEEEVDEIRFFPILEFGQDIRVHPEKYIAPGSYWFEVADELKRKSGL
jgi:isopentenyldiphosphate isomerase